MKSRAADVAAHPTVIAANWTVLGTTYALALPTFFSAETVTKNSDPIYPRRLTYKSW